VARWLSDAHGTDDDIPQLFYETVRHNAFGLETPLLGVEYGAAWYETSCRLNHSCAPNCVSVRLGGNMAIFASRDIHTGEELTHSYLPPRLLLLPEAARAAHLHFAPCECDRCTRARGSSEPLRDAAATLFPPGHAATDDGALIAQFKLLSAADGALALASADALLRRPSVVEMLRTRPLACLDVCLPMLQAHWTRVAVASGTPSEGPDAAVAGVCLPLAAELAHAAAYELIAMTESTIPIWARWHVVHATAISRYLLAHNPLADAVRQRATIHRPWIDKERELVDRAIRAVRGLSCLYGNGLSCLRDDLPFMALASTTRPSLQRLAELCDEMPAARRDDAALRQRLGQTVGESG